jgi:hypothetical protein
MASRKDRRRKQPADDQFYTLDNSAVFTAAIAGAAGAFVFRFSADLDETVRLPELSRALAALKGRFPFLFVSLGHGVFWHYLEPLRGDPRLEREDRWPAAPIAYRRGRPLVRVTVYGRRIAAEFHHAVTDGTGGLAFLRALIVEYLALRGVGADLPREAFGDIPRPGDPYDPEEEEDAYGRYFRREAPLPDPAPPAFLMPGKRRRRGYRVVAGSIPLDAALRCAKERSVTLTELLTAVHLAALQDLYEDGRRSGRRRVVSVQVPINLRKIYPSRTLRNFFLFASPSIDTRLGHWEFDEILRRVHHSLRLGIEKKELLRQLRRNVGGERNPFGRFILLPVKLVVLRAINRAIGVGAYSGSMSNLGQIWLPEHAALRVRDFDCAPSRASATGANVLVLSWGGRLRVTVGSLVVDRAFERKFFGRLAALGLDVLVETNETDTRGVV